MSIDRHWPRKVFESSGLPSVSTLPGAFEAIAQDEGKGTVYRILHKSVGYWSRDAFGNAL